MMGLARMPGFLYYPLKMRTSRTLNVLAGLFALLLLLAALPVRADDSRIITILSRRGVPVSFYYMTQDKARATLVLLPGGKGDIKLRDGTPESDDFLVRSRGYFFANGFNVVVVNKPDDVEELNFRARTSFRHTEDIKQITAYVKEDSRLPVWLIGTSRGTISATAAAIAMTPDSLSGIVLTSSITSPVTPGAVPSQNLAKIRIPVLVVHHEDDSCRICDPDDVPEIMQGLCNSPVKKAVLVKGGWWARGRACGPRHYHSYIGMEKKVAALISQWIQNPAL